MYFKVDDDIQLTIPINNAKIYYDVSKGHRGKLSIDAAPKASVKNANWDLYFSGMNIFDKYVDYWNKQGRCGITGIKSKKLKYSFQNSSIIYMYLPGVHHIAYSDNMVHQVEITNTEKFFKSSKNLYVKAFVAVSDKVIFGVMSFDDVLKLKTLYIKEVAGKAVDGVLDATGLPKPVPKRTFKVYVKEDFWYNLKDIHDKIKEKHDFVDYKMNNEQRQRYKDYRYMMMELFSPYVGQYDPEKYKINLRAIKCNTELKRFIDKCTYVDCFTRQYFGCRLDRKLRARMSIDFNRVLIKYKE
jgi:hypothetical protein